MGRKAPQLAWLAAIPIAVTGMPAGAIAAPSVRLATTGNDSELVQAVPIERHVRAGRRVVMSLAPKKIPRLEAGDRVRLSAEVEVTTTCVDPGDPRCVGRPYSFSPTAGAQIVLADGKRVAKGRHAVPLSGRKTVRCGQHRPNRNHHCVITFPAVSWRPGTSGGLPCHLNRCFINLTLDARAGNARNGNLLLAGSDRPDGTVKQDLGRLTAVVIPPGSSGHEKRRRTRSRVHRSIPMGSPGSGGQRVVYSVKLSSPQAGDVIAVQARQPTSIDPLPYNAYVSTEVVLAGRPGAVRANPRFSSQRGRITEANGFNCTQGPSAFRTPCQSSKAGAVSIRRDALNPAGNPRPLYVNLISRSFPKLASADPGDAANVLDGGFLSVVRFR
jgi:hypothetical protein